LAAFLNTQPPPVPVANDIAITTKVKGAARALTLDGATLTSAGQTVEGAITVEEANGPRHLRHARR
jgi:hypothetical protein